ncbi:uncharacterized protein LDX57_006537 [Aspergillus melleus]|uniref:uncharacterized protein n=1 Tax=Aspergillus melleus TaxID=138277 RepID=UPI001E8D6204|nr:uncharacterized protein LDX57_006537 [Aspergillus melleus]KAH8428860.1 hypothetical protein LDX57_006537 [Aspergillus melleus]
MSAAVTDVAWSVSLNPFIYIGTFLILFVQFGYSGKARVVGRLDRLEVPGVLVLTASGRAARPSSIDRKQHLQEWIWIYIVQIYPRLSRESGDPDSPVRKRIANLVLMSPSILPCPLQTHILRTIQDVQQPRTKNIKAVQSTR